jgi:hypothetical protein
MAHTKPGECGEAAQREVANDFQEFLVAEDPSGAAGFVSPDFLPQQDRADRVGQPFLQRGCAVQRARLSRYGDVERRAEPEVA